MAVVVDTDVVSFLYKRDTRADLYRPHLDGQLPIISFMTLAELEHWTVARDWGARRRQDLLITVYLPEEIGINRGATPVTLVTPVTVQDRDMVQGSEVDRGDRGGCPKFCVNELSSRRSAESLFPNNHFNRPALRLRQRGVSKARQLLFTQKI